MCSYQESIVNLLKPISIDVETLSLNKNSNFSFVWLDCQSYIPGGWWVTVPPVALLYSTTRPVAVLNTITPPDTGSNLTTSSKTPGTPIYYLVQRVPLLSV